MPKAFWARKDSRTIEKKSPWPVFIPRRINKPTKGFIHTNNKIKAKRKKNKQKICEVFIAILWQQRLIIVGYNQPSFESQKVFLLILVGRFQEDLNKETATMLVDQNNPRGIGLHFYINFFCSINAYWRKSQHKFLLIAFP